MQALKRSTFVLGHDTRHDVGGDGNGWSATVDDAPGGTANSRQDSPPRPSVEPRSRHPSYANRCARDGRSYPITAERREVAREDPRERREAASGERMLYLVRDLDHALGDAPRQGAVAHGMRQRARGAAVVMGLAAAVLATAAYAQGIDDVRRISGRELDEAWANRSTSADEAITNLVRGHLAELNVGTPATVVRFLPYENVPIEEECRMILTGKDYRLTADELPSTVTLRWGKSPEGGVTVDTTLRYEVNDRRREDNALKFFSYPTLLAEQLADGSYHAQVLVPIGPTFSQLAAIGKLYETGETVQLDPANSDYDSVAGRITAIRLDEKVQRVVRDHFLPLESFVSHPIHSPRRNKSRFRLGYIKALDVAYIIRSRVYDVFLIRGGKIRLSRAEPWTFIQNARAYNNPARQRRFQDLCVTVFPKTRPDVRAELLKP